MSIISKNKFGFELTSDLLQHYKSALLKKIKIATSSGVRLSSKREPCDSNSP